MYPVSKLIAIKCINPIDKPLNLLEAFQFSGVKDRCYGFLNIEAAFHTKRE